MTRETPDRLSRRSLLKAAGVAIPVVGSASGLLTACGSSSSSSKPDKLVVAGGGGAITAAYRKAYYEPYTKKTGIKIVETTNDISKLKSMVKYGDVEWDVAQVDPVPGAAAGLDGLLEPLDYDVIGHDGLDSKLTHKFYLPSDFAALALSWNTKSVRGKGTPKNWSDLLDVHQFPGQRGLQKAPSQTMEIALLADGVPPDKLYPIDVDRALRVLDRIKGKISWWSSGAQSSSFLANGQVALEAAWNGRLQDPKDQGEPVDFTLRHSLLVADAWIVPKGAKHKKAAMQFIAFCMKAENQAKLAKYVPYGPANSKALEAIGASKRARLPNAKQNDYAVVENFNWWAKNQDRVLKRWNDWIIS